MKTSVFLLFVLVFSSLNAQKGVIMTNTKAFKHLIADGNDQILDVRTKKEFAKGHIKGALNIDYWNPKFLDLVKSDFDKSIPLLVYCAGGGRSAMASERLKKKGYKLIYDLEGGYEAYTE